MRTKRTVLNAIFSMLGLLISSLMSLLLTRLILVNLGSDYNGINGTVTQFLSILMLFESGLTVAALVKLYNPFHNNDYHEINKLLSKVRIEFKRIGILILVFGVISSSIYSIFIKTNVNYLVVLLMFFMSIASTAFNFYYSYKYRLLFQVSQLEYLVYIVHIGQYIIMYSGMILIIQYTKNIVLARGFYLLLNIVAGVVIGAIARKRFPFISFDSDCSMVKIEGTRDLFISKLVGMLYNSLTPFYLAVFVGTLQTSVYFVFNSVIAIVNNIVNTTLLAPQNALGQIINSDQERLGETMKEYEFTSLIISSTLLATTMALIIPFIRIFTARINDVEYVQPVIAILLLLITATQIVHIPSGKCIELSGNFKVVRRIQLVAFSMLTVLSIIGVYYYGLTGLLIAKLFTNIILAILEIRYAHTKIIRGSLISFLWITIPNIIIACVLAAIESVVLYNAHISVFSFVVIGFILLIMNLAVLILFGYLFNRHLLKHVINRFLVLFNAQRRTN